MFFVKGLRSCLSIVYRKKDIIYLVKKIFRNNILHFVFRKSDILWCFSKKARKIAKRKFYDMFS